MNMNEKSSDKVIEYVETRILAGKLAAGDRLAFKGLRAAVAGDGRLTVRTKAGDVTLQTALSAREKAIILAGGLLCLRQ